jgi:hypothetical protein
MIMDYDYDYGLGLLGNVEFIPSSLKLKLKMTHDIHRPSSSWNVEFIPIVLVLTYPNPKTKECSACNV